MSNIETLVTTASRDVRRRDRQVAFDEAHDVVTSIGDLSKARHVLARANFTSDEVELAMSTLAHCCCDPLIAELEALAAS